LNAFLRFKAVGRLGAALLILAWLFHLAGVGEVWHQLERARPEFLAFAVLCCIGEYGARVLNWRKSLHALQEPAGTCSRLAGVYFYSSLLGQVVPSSLGTDAIRVALAQRAFGGCAGTVAASLVVLNAQTLFAGIVLTVIGFSVLNLQGRLPEELVPILQCVAMLAITIPMFYLLLRVRQDLVLLGLRKVSHRRLLRFRRGLRRFVDAMLLFERSQASSLGGLLLTAMLAVTMQAGIFGFTAAAFGLELPVAVWLALPPIVALAAVLPMSVLGFGAHQGAVVLVLVAFAAPVDAALACGLVAAAIATTFLVSAGTLSMLCWKPAGCLPNG
jgi:uncharacterized protein (TIRG00374 family)